MAGSPVFDVEMDEDTIAVQNSVSWVFKIDVSVLLRDVWPNSNQPNAFAKGIVVLGLHVEKLVLYCSVIQYFCSDVTSVVC